jgi:putative Mg2+ transporter-C (MgtC) family protein
MTWDEQLWVISNTAIAMVLGGLVGVEREMSNRPAGFRTHMLVAGASALLLGIGMTWLQHTREIAPGMQVQSDPLRLVEAVIAGVAFIGAGTIFSRGQKQTIAGITTAASLLMVSVIGVAAGLSYHLLAIGATVLTLATLTVLKWFDRVLRRRAGLPASDEEDRDDVG